MIGGKRVLALVPARRGSKGLPLKNIRPLHGMPLLAWPIKAARASQYVDRVVISTDDADFAALAQAAGADAPFLRPPELATDSASSIGVIIHALDALKSVNDEYDYLVLLEPTSPLTEASDVDAALKTLVARSRDADAIVGVTPLSTSHPAFAVRVNERGLISPFATATFRHLPRRQDVEPLYCLDGSLYASTTEALRSKSSFCHDRTIAHIMPRHKSFEVDDLVDFVCIEALLARRGRDESPTGA